jgi:CTP synthase (UTP-ammonia lyase)
LGGTYFGGNMAATTRIGLIGDHDATVPAHQAIPIALQIAGEALALDVAWEWAPTDEILDPSRVASFDGLWCVPASPYRSMEGALLAINFAREHGRPFLGTCGGFQHAIIEYARNAVGWADAEHAETAPDAVRPVITPLACALVEATDAVRFRPGSRIASAYGCEESAEGYRCRYGLNPVFQVTLVSGPLRAGAYDATGEIRAVELDDHPFFLATLFQPERAALKGQLPPLVAAFVRASAVHAAQQHAAADAQTAARR